MAYLGSAHFVEAVFENWESEFLQMAAFVLLTIALKQKGSSESKPLEEKSERPKPKPAKTSPWPVRRGGWIRKLYENSLTIALAFLFVLSFGLHALGGAGQENRERARHGERAVGRLEYVGTAQFWFESFQNWQSEFLAVGVLIVLSIFLREARPNPRSPRNPREDGHLIPACSRAMRSRAGRACGRAHRSAENGTVDLGAARRAESYGTGVGESTVEVVVVVSVTGWGVPVDEGASLVVEVSVVVVVVSRFWHPSASAAVPAIRKPTMVSVLFIALSS